MRVLPSFLCVRRRYLLMLYPHAMCINHQPSLTITTSYPSNNLSFITFIITGHRMVAVNPHINNNDGIIIGLFLFLSPPKTTLFLVRIGVIFLESLVSDYFYFFEPSQQPLWKTKQYDTGINCLGQLLGLP